jgi:hypothetical protein
MNAAISVLVVRQMKEGLVSDHREGVATIRVAEAYPELSIRIDNCPFKHHQIVAALPEWLRQEMLADAAGEGWSASRLQGELTGSVPPIESEDEEESQLIQSRVVGSIDELVGERFGCIYADPPWKYGNQGTRAATKNHYDTMSIDELCAMPVKELAAAFDSSQPASANLLGHSLGAMLRRCGGAV